MDWRGGRQSANVVDATDQQVPLEDFIKDWYITSGASPEYGMEEMVRQGQEQWMNNRRRRDPSREIMRSPGEMGDAVRGYHSGMDQLLQDILMKQSRMAGV